ncbi:hypothetical protein I6H88_19940 [Elizabethkingia bruuniana]|uniref:Uncharacterized protein n=2 Tax=Elizabethkingia TaxID=308865 RepID=A0A7T7UYR4_9FLAO|nr:DUF1040 family protein [Elizabethkingia bruuniana]KGO09506.1 hypothetical protein KS04_13545 [Elizabethkingia miricola]AQX85174.1 hypothetical protein AYC65_09220 [Elizabethkingia bruuniana]KUY28639.1 hypothetical protein ATB97_00450 [Elizabethkingia bruuniana]OPB70268.1 hypothetical protein BAY12_16560 [Elizabethkingia bruuniana]QDZ62438.1 hypothetical protein EVD20_05965 [Elizabethkingia bruuniana]
MRKPDRIKIVLEQIEQLWMSNPDFRFGQLIMVIAQTGEHNPKLFHMEEDELLEKIKVLQNQLENIKTKE